MSEGEAVACQEAKRLVGHATLRTCLRNSGGKSGSVQDIMLWLMYSTSKRLNFSSTSGKEPLILFSLTRSSVRFCKAR